MLASVCRVFVAAAFPLLSLTGCDLAGPPEPTQTVVVDAGHGGKDPGKVGPRGLPEKTIALDIAMKVAERLEKEGVKVVRTRRSDSFVGLDERAATANRTKADLLISIHADAAEIESASGMTLFIARNALDQSKTLARSVETAITSAGFACRGIRQNDFRVLANHSRPALLVETGFLTNKTEARKLNDPAYRARIADAIAEGVISYLSAQN